MKQLDNNDNACNGLSSKRRAQKRKKINNTKIKQWY